MISGKTFQLPLFIPTDKLDEIKNYSRESIPTNTSSYSHQWISCEVYSTILSQFCDCRRKNPSLCKLSTCAASQAIPRDALWQAVLKMNCTQQQELITIDRSQKVPCLKERHSASCLPRSLPPHEPRKQQLAAGKEQSLPRKS